MMGLWLPLWAFGALSLGLQNRDDKIEAVRKTDGVLAKEKIEALIVLPSNLKCSRQIRHKFSFF